MSIKESDFDFESMKDLALEQLRSGEKSAVIQTLKFKNLKNNSLKN